MKTCLHTRTRLTGNNNTSITCLRTHELYKLEGAKKTQHYQPNFTTMSSRKTKIVYCVFALFV